MLDLTQIGLDIVGVFDPTPVSDAANTLISLSRGELMDAAINAVAMIPYFGDLAKVGKLGAYPKKLARAINLALKNEKARAVLRPMLKQLQESLARLPLEKLPDDLRKPLENVKNQLDNFFSKLKEPPPTPTGQIHHPISKKVDEALKKHPKLAGEYEPRDPRITTQAIDKAAHNGWPKWHRDLDKEVAQWIAKHPKATKEEFETWLRWRYSQPDLKARFPNGF